VQEKAMKYYDKANAYTAAELYWPNWC